jgi:DNA polymerase I-like protein with 3'-5' exonuclease and polymerase domains
VDAPGFNGLAHQYGTGGGLTTEPAAPQLLYASPADIAADIEAGADPHTKAAAALFGRAPEQVTREERRWAKYLNMAAVTGVSFDALVDLAQAPAGTVRAMLDRYHQTVVA